MSNTLTATFAAREIRNVAASSTTLTGVGFTSDDVGKAIVIGGAGASGGRLSTTISAFVSDTQVELAEAATTSVTGASAVYGPDCSEALQEALSALVEARGGVLEVVGLFLLAAPVSITFGGEGDNAAISIRGTGSDSAIWIGTASDADAISIASCDLKVSDLNFIGIPGNQADARRVLNLVGVNAVFDSCGFYGLATGQGVIYADGCSVHTENCMFGGSFAMGGQCSVIENKNWVSYSDERSSFIDYGSFRTQFYSKSGIAGTLGWVRADTAYGSDGTRGESVFRLRGTRMDEGSFHGVVVKPSAGIVNHVKLEGVRHNVTAAEGGRGIHCEDVQSVIVEHCWYGWAPTSSRVGHFQDCGAVMLDSLKLSDSVNRLSATNVQALTLKDTVGVSTFTFVNVGFHSVDSRYRDSSKVKDGPISDADFPSPPAIGTQGYDRTNNRLYIKRVSTEGWIYFSMDGGETLGPELVVNGTGESVTGWSTALGASVSLVNGALRVTNNTAHGRAFQSVPTVAGQQYRFSIDMPGGTAPRQVRVGTTQGSANYLPIISSPGGSGTFTATGTSAVITLMLPSETAGTYADFDNISLRAS